MSGNHGCMSTRGARPHPAYARYIAMLDVLGMNTWLEHESARNIAESLDKALAACEPASSGDTSDGTKYGPLIGVTHFSDSIFLWSPDDSWSSLVTMCGAAKMVVTVALANGVPLRGAIASGEVVCQPTTLRFVGRAIAEAFHWSEKERKYRSVGVDLTPQTIEKLKLMAATNPLPDCWRSERHGIDEAVLKGQKASSPLLMWHEGCLFINHWRHGTFVGENPGEMFLRRSLPVSSEDKKCVQDKVAQMLAFFEASCRDKDTENRETTSREREEQQRRDRQLEFLRLDRLKTERDCPTRRCT
jgi:hypothetical protein